MTTMQGSTPHTDRDPRRAGVRRTIWISVSVVVVMLALFCLQHI